jgi:hypothetical protein
LVALVAALRGCFAALCLFVAEDLIVLPGKAFAAMSDSTAVNATEPAMIQRFALRSRPSAVSRV